MMRINPSLLYVQMWFKFCAEEILFLNFPLVFLKLPSLLVCLRFYCSCFSLSCFWIKIFGYRYQNAKFDSFMGSSLIALFGNKGFGGGNR
jgi:hypothetical protein